MTEFRFLALGSALSIMACLFPGAAGAQVGGDKPRIWASVARPTGIQEGQNTPLWNRVKVAIGALAKNDPTKFAALLKPNADMQLLNRSSRSAFPMSSFKAAIASCHGPFLVNEGKAWVQFSWICRVQKPTPLDKIYTFKETPELAITVWFEDNKVSVLEASEPGLVPGLPAIPMGAAEQMDAQ